MKLWVMGHVGNFGQTIYVGNIGKTIKHLTAVYSNNSTYSHNQIM